MIGISTHRVFANRVAQKTSSLHFAGLKLAELKPGVVYTTADSGPNSRLDGGTNVYVVKHLIGSPVTLPGGRLVQQQVIVDRRELFITQTGMGDRDEQTTLGFDPTTGENACLQALGPDPIQPDKPRATHYLTSNGQKIVVSHQ
ncbi:MAG: hypothetical protein K2X01_05190 [Cyanobacteria bacterium]|nr:hypothetical protein [Cyanobacteriota bacterium]